MLIMRTAGRLCLPALAILLASWSRSAADEVQFFPADTEFVVSVHFRQMLESELVKSNKESLDLLKGMMEQNAQAQKYLKELGFDPFRDLDGVTVVSPASADPARILVLITGKFQPRKFAATAARAARENGDVVKTSRSGKHEIIEITLPGKNEATFVALADAKTLVASQSKSILIGALNQGGSDKEPELKKEVKDLLTSRAKDASASFAATGAAVGKLLAASKDPRIAGMGPVMAKFLEKIDGFNGSITLAADVQFQLGVGTKTAEAAKEFAQQAQIGLPIVGFALAKQAKDNPKLAPVMDILRTLRASAEGNTFIIRGRVPAEVVQKALKGGFNP